MAYKIAQLCLRYPPASGGVEEFTAQLVNLLRQNPKVWQVSVFTSRLLQHHPPRELSARQIRSDPPYLRRYPVFSPPRLAYPVLRGLRKALLRESPDLIHAHGFWYHPVDVGARVARRLNIPFVLHPYYYSHGPRRKLLWQTYRRLWGRHTVALADIICVISPYERRLLEEAEFPVRRFVLLPPGIDTAALSRPRPANPFLRFNMPQGAPVILFAGRIAQAKGVDILIKAFAHLPRSLNAVLAFAGEDFGYQQAARQMAEALGVSDRIFWLGKLSREELIAAYQHACIAALPSRYEAFGIVLAEAQAAGTPVVATRAAAIPFVAREGEGALLFAPENISACAECLASLLRNEKFRRDLGAAGKRRVQRLFSLEKTRRRLFALYRELL
jgi:glycosyltransferase involved in cell wall biosynthesis